jgi:hypothetical protein
MNEEALEAAFVYVAITVLTLCFAGFIYIEYCNYYQLWY